ncbi:MAG: hypothetical protein K6G04_02140 [Lachnospiraceae bacterium]|nr:hypothetical protein [Lachnospiraceae bacterium]
MYDERDVGFTTDMMGEDIVMHGVPFGLATGNLLVAVALTLLPGAIGFYLGWVNEKQCGGSILPSWLLHGITNVVVSCMTL